MHIRMYIFTQNIVATLRRIEHANAAAYAITFVCLEYAVRTLYVTYAPMVLSSIPMVG